MPGTEVEVELELAADGRVVLQTRGPAGRRRKSRFARTRDPSRDRANFPTVELIAPPLA